MLVITATYINYYHICKHKLWLFSHGIKMEHTSDLILEGKSIHKNTFLQRAKKYTEVSLAGGKIDFYDAKKKIIHEVKKSSRMLHVDVWQVKYYIWLMESNGIFGVTGKIQYPVFRQTKTVTLTDADREYLIAIRKEIQEIIEIKKPPRRVRKDICPSCSYYDFCWIGAL
jgi:CRISPR-associated exonuclease Cas4